ncbi:MAG TPA: LacI family DNA-binding transcriptional regulator [Dermatophilaceae bacterium]
MRHQERTTINDVASEAGVSIATVSKVLNGRYGVAVTTTARVQEVIDRLGYESSLVARSLRSHRTNVIGVLVAEFEPFSTELLKGMSKAIGGSGYELLAYSGGGRTGGNAGWERRYLSRLSGTLIDGAILVTPSVVDAEYGIPVVAVDPHTGPSGVPTVDCDSLAGAITATDYLIGLGHRRIGFLGGRPDLESSRFREQGYRQALDEAGIPLDPALIRVGGYREETADLPAHELLTMADPPTAVFAANDLSAIRTMDVARSLGVSVPESLSVIGFDNVPESALCTPPLTTINQPIQQMGFEAMKFLIDLINGTPIGDPHRQLPTKLVLRGSCRAL